MPMVTFTGHPMDGLMDCSMDPPPRVSPWLPGSTWHGPLIVYLMGRAHSWSFGAPTLGDVMTSRHIYTVSFNGINHGVDHGVENKNCSLQLLVGCWRMLPYRCTCLFPKAPPLRGARTDHLEQKTTLSQTNVSSYA